MTEHSIPSACQNIQASVNIFLDLARKDSSVPFKEISAVETSLQKATSPRFEIVFAGAFSAGKSMLINALLGQELLYSAEGHATGTECFIEYAEPNNQRVVLEFLSKRDISEQITALCQRLVIEVQSNLERLEGIELLVQQCQEIIQQEGGESKSDRAKQANALKLLIEGYYANQEHIRSLENATYSMEQLNFSNLREAASYARRGSNSAVLKKIEYYYHHDLLKDGNVIIDTPGIDAPVEKDRRLTYEKILSPDTSAVICVLKAASTGEIGDQETKLLETIRSSPAIRDRVFYIFNRIDEIWYNSQLKRKFDEQIKPQFREVKSYETSALLGFYGNHIQEVLVKKHGNSNNHLDDNSLNDFFEGLNSIEETPQFVYEFNKYCSMSGKLNPNEFRVSVHSYQTQNQNFLRILNEQGNSIIDRLIKDSCVKDFSTAITNYLTEEKRPQLFTSLADDLQALCTSLRQQYIQQYQLLEGQPKEIKSLKDLEMRRLQRSLGEIGKAFENCMNNAVNQVSSYQNALFEGSFRQLKLNVLKQMDILLNEFSVLKMYADFSSYRNNSTAPLMAILVESFYYLAKGLEVSLSRESEKVIQQFFGYLVSDISEQDFYRELKSLLGDDAGILQRLKDLENDVGTTMREQANLECDEYIRESHHFYDLVLESGAKQLIEPFIKSLIEIINSSSGQPQGLLGSLRNLLGDNSSGNSFNLDVQHVIDMVLNLKRNYISTSGGSFSLYQFRQELQPIEGDYKSVADQKYIIPRLDEKKQNISHLLEQDFGFKIYRTLRDSFRQKMNQTLKRDCLRMAGDHQEVIQQQYERARGLLEQVAEKRANEQLDRHAITMKSLQSNRESYNKAVDSINECLQALKLGGRQLYRIEN